MGHLLELAKRLSRVAVPPVLLAENQREPLEPASLLAVPSVLPVPPKKLKINVKEQPVASDPTPEAMAWLAQIASLLGCTPDHLLARSFIDQHDLAEQYRRHPQLAAHLIRSHPDWSSPAPADNPTIVQHDAEELQGIHHSAATASPKWYRVRDHFHGHLFACRLCHAPTGRYCGAGAELREQYDATPWSAP